MFKGFFYRYIMINRDGELPMSGPRPHPCRFRWAKAQPLAVLFGFFFPSLLYMIFWYISKGCRPCRRPRKNPQWIKPNWQKWRTEKHQNCAQTLPNVTSETYRKLAILATFSSCFLLLLLLLLLLLFKKTSSKRSCLKSNNSQRQIPTGVWRTEKHQNCAQTLPNVTSETYRKLAILATFSSCFLLLLLPLLLLLLLFKKASSKGSRLKSNHSQRQIPTAVEDGKASKLRPNTPSM